MNSLNLTQRQVCEKLAQTMDKNFLKANGYQAFISSITSNGTAINLTTQDLVDFGIIDEGKHIKSISWTTDPVLNGSFLESKAISIHNENDHYENLNEWHNIRSTWPNGTLADNISNPIMDTVQQAGFITLASYARSKFDYGTSSFETDFVLMIGDRRITLCHLSVYNDDVTVTNVISDASEVLQSLSVVVAGASMMSELCSALSNGIHTPGDLSAILGHYVNSSCSSISTFAKRILQAGRNSMNDALRTIIELFRNNFTDYSEDEEGNITWNIQTNPVSTNFWAVAGNIIIGGAQVLGTILLFAGSVLAKIVGGLIYIGSSVIQAFNQALGSITGTIPYVNDEAIDQCYHDPIGQQDGLILLKNKLHPDFLETIVSYGKVKIVSSSMTLYLYNFKDNGSTYTCDAKVFANLTTPAPAYSACVWYDSDKWGVQSKATKIQASRWTVGFFNLIIEHTGLSSTDKYWGWNLTDNDGKRWGYNSNKNLIQITNNPRPFAEFVKFVEETSNKASGVSLTSRSADASEWLSLWDILRVNVIATLTLAFSNPMFYHNESGVSDHAVDVNNNHGYNLSDFMYYGQYTGSPGYTSIINGIISLANYDHSNDSFFVSILNSLGLYYGFNTSVQVTQHRVYADTDGTRGAEGYQILDFHGIEETKTLTKSSQQYLDESIGIFPFLAIDHYAYVTPPTCDFKSIIWGAVLATALVAAAVVGIVVAKTVIKKKISFKMQNEGKRLLDEGATFRNGFTPEEFNQLSKEDQATYYNAYKSYMRQVKWYNFKAKCFGLSTLDWVNNWWNAETSSAPALVTPEVSSGISPESIIAAADNYSSNNCLREYDMNQQEFDANPPDNLLLYRILTGLNPR